MDILKIAFRNLNRQKKRSILLAIAVSFSFFVVILIDGLSAGMMKAVEYQLVNQFGGHVFIIGAEKAASKADDDDAVIMLRDTEVINRILEENGIKAVYAAERISTDGGTYIFDGKELAAGSLFGCDFDNEPLLHESITFVEGGWDSMKKPNALLIDENTAGELDLRLHDTVLFETKTVFGQLTVVELQIEGISKSAGEFSKLFAYTNLDFLGQMLDMPEGAFGMYSLYLKNSEEQDGIANLFEREFARLNIPVTSRTEAHKISPQSPQLNLLKQLGYGKWEGTKYAVASFYDFAPQMVTFVDMIRWISLGVLFVLLAITMIGVANTFRMIVHERKGEIGTMRSCGMRRVGVKTLFVSEAFLLALMGGVAGFLVAIGLMQGLSLIRFPNTFSLIVFAHNGHFIWRLSPVAVLLKFTLVGLLTVFAALGPASQAANMIPSEALRVGK